MLSITPIPAFADNYIWAITNLARSRRAIVVDPGDAAATEQFLQQSGLDLAAILVTHHHADHTGGVVELADRYHAKVYGPKNDLIQGITHPVGEDDEIPELIDGVCKLRVLAVPGHTLDHIAYLGDGFVFCGDTLFAAGCGRLFEGSPAQMHNSLQRLAALPAETRVYCTHEYTLSNLRFALAVEPGHAAVQQRVFDEAEKRDAGLPTLPTTISLERSTNPFLRTGSREVAASAERFSKLSLQDELEVFAALRRWKNDFR